MDGAGNRSLCFRGAVRRRRQHRSSMLRVPGTVDLLLFSAPFSAHSRSNLSIFASRDSGATWQFERTVDGRSSAYSALIDINASHYGVA